MLQQVLKRKGLRKSPCRDTTLAGMEDMAKLPWITEVSKFLYKISVNFELLPVRDGTSQLRITDSNAPRRKQFLNLTKGNLVF